MSAVICIDICQPAHLVVQVCDYQFGCQSTKFVSNASGEVAEGKPTNWGCKTADRDR